MWFDHFLAEAEKIIMEQEVLMALIDKVCFFYFAKRITPGQACFSSGELLA
jgi:hypothetical protein